MYLIHGVATDLTAQGRADSDRFVVQAADKLRLRALLNPKCRISAEHEGVGAERESSSQ